MDTYTTGLKVIKLFIRIDQTGWTLTHWPQSHQTFFEYDCFYLYSKITESEHWYLLKAVFILAIVQVQVQKSYTKVAWPKDQSSGLLTRDTLTWVYYVYLTTTRSITLSLLTVILGKHFALSTSWAYLKMNCSEAYTSLLIRDNILNLHTTVIPSRGEI